MPPTIPNFHLIRQIGEGGFGEVWLAETVTGKPRAVKWVRRERFQRPGLSAAGVEALFRMEFEGVQHFEDIAAKTPELINILHVGKTGDDDAYYYVMPLADNALSEEAGLADSNQPLTLQRWLEMHGPMDWPDATALLATIARGTAALHHAGLHHGDISSSNVLWVDGRPVLGDPGLTSLDGKNTGGGSPGFADPAGQSGKTSDVFSLGRLFYHALSGSHPAESFPSLPADRLAGIPACQLADLLDRCCDPDPAARFHDADELLEFLAPITGQSPSRPRRRRPLLLAGLTMGLVCVLAMAGWRLARPERLDFFPVIDGGKLSLISKATNLPAWERELDHPLNQAELADLDGDQQPEIICSMRETGRERPGRVTALNFDGSIRWQFDAAPELQDFAGPGQVPMRIAGFKTAELDGVAGNELVVFARNTDCIFTGALQILGNDGKLRASYWHPGRIEPNELIIVRGKPDQPPLLAFYGENDLIEPSVSADNLPVQERELVIGLLDPRIKGRAHLPIHAIPRGETGQLLRWHRRITPPGGRGRFLYASDEDGDGIKDLVLQMDPPAQHSGSITWPRVAKFDLHGNPLHTATSEIEAAPADNPPPVPSGLQAVDFGKLNRKSLLAHSVRDFSEHQNGHHGWHYGFAPADGDYDPSRFRLFEHCDTRSEVGRFAWNKHDDSHLSVERGSMHPEELERVVRRWVAPSSGRIAVVVNAKRVCGFNWGITSLEIHHRDTRLVRAALGKSRFHAAFEVSEGDSLDFVIDAAGRTWGDQTDILIGIWKYD